MVLAIRTLMLFAMGFSATLLELLSTPTDPFWTAHPTAARVFELYLLAKDLVALGALAGVAYFVWLRAVVKPDRLTRSWEAYLILGFIAGLMVTEFIFGASHLVLQRPRLHALGAGHLGGGDAPVTASRRVCSGRSARRCSGRT